MSRLDGPNLVQELNVVIRATAEATLGNFDPPNRDPVTGLPPIDDPSTPGPPSSWGTHPLDPGPPPITPQTMGTRDPGSIGGGPGGSGGNPPKRRRGGSPRQPQKNTLTEAPGQSGPKACFSGYIQVQITKPAPDPFGWTGQQPSFIMTSGSCQPYNPPTINRPATALVFTDLIDQVKAFLRSNTAPDGFATVILDSVNGPSGSCLNSGSCAGFTGVPVNHGTGVGAIITQ